MKKVAVEKIGNGRYVVRSPFGKKIANVSSRDKAYEIADDAQKAIDECFSGENEYVVTARVTTIVRKKIKADSIADASLKISKGYADFLDWGVDDEFATRPEILLVKEA